MSEVTFTTVRFDSAEPTQADVLEQVTETFGPAARNHVELATDWLDKSWARPLEYFVESEGQVFAEKQGTRQFTTVGQPSDTQRTSVLQEIGGESVPLEPSNHDPRTLLRDDFLSRRSKRKFSGRPVPLNILSSLLQEPTGWRGTAFQAFDLFVVAYSVEQLEPGIYHVNRDASEMSLVREGSFRHELRSMMCGMPAPLTAHFVLIYVADFHAWMDDRPYSRGLRELYVEVGRASQRMVIAAEARGLATMISPATNDDAMAALLGLPSMRWAPVYTITTGWAARSREMPD